VPQGSVLGPLLFLNDISSVVSMKLFVDDITIYKEIVCPEDVDFNWIYQKLFSGSYGCCIFYNPEKCESIVISNKKSPPVQALFGC